MAGEDVERYIIRRGRRYSYRRRVPSDLVEVLGQHVKISLQTDSLDVARRVASGVNESVISYWAELRAGGSADVLEERYRQAVALARRLGWAYRPIEELARAPAGDLVERLQALRDVTDRRTVAAVMGGVPEPRFRLSGLRTEFDRLTPETRRGKSEQQVRAAGLPRDRAVRNLIGVVGDKPLAEVTRDDALTFREWWAARLEAEDLTPNAANKDLTALAAMWRVVNDKHRLGLDDVWRGMRFSEGGGGPGRSRGETVSTEWIVSRLLAPGSLPGLNDEARQLVAVLAETGARPGEVCGLEADDIVLQHEVPHIRIRPNKTRAIKTAHSVRDIPLVGAALPAMRALVAAGGVTRYLGKAPSFTTAVNKYLRENGVFESEQQSLYSLRHALQDRLIAVDCPDRVAAELMGHRFHRPRYGAGASLAHRREWLERIALVRMHV